MIADPAEPVGRIAGVRLAAMHQAMPVTSLGRFQILADAMCLFSEIMI